jgi:hypothetical protein
MENQLNAIQSRRLLEPSPLKVDISPPKLVVSPLKQPGQEGGGLAIKLEPVGTLPIAPNSNRIIVKADKANKENKRIEPQKREEDEDDDEQS